MRKTDLFKLFLVLVLSLSLFVVGCSDDDDDEAKLPGKPANLTAQTTATEVTLNWDAASDASSYKVTRASGGTTTTLVNDLTETTYIDNSIEPGKSYFYQVFAVNSEGETASDAVSVDMPIATLNAPTNVTVTRSGDDMQIAWTAPAERFTMMYRVQRKNMQGNYVTIAEDLTETSYTDEDVVEEKMVLQGDYHYDLHIMPNKPYCYRVVAYTDEPRISEPSDAGEATVPTTYLLKGAVFIGDGGDENGEGIVPATLTIDAGTTIYGEMFSSGTLIINRGSKIIAEGTKDAPIVLTTDQPVGQRKRGLWGGLVINGKAVLNNPDGYSNGEGNSGLYGGNDDNDNSGVLRYVRVEYAGIRLTTDDELNGIGFQAVGSGTTIDHVQVHSNLDDGVEFFGGTCNAKHLVLTNIGDDSFDYTLGFRGKVQFIVVQQNADEADRGFECDNWSSNHEATPLASPQIYNATLIGDPRTGEDYPGSDAGMMLRAGTGGTFANIIAMGFKDAGLDIDDPVTIGRAKAGELNVTNCIFYDNYVSDALDNFKHDSEDDDEDFDIHAWARDGSRNNLEATTSPVADAYNLTNPNFKSTGVALTHTPATPPADGFFESVDFIGGVDPNDDWTEGWTTSAQE